jgi:hypothetical protein
MSLMKNAEKKIEQDSGPRKIPVIQPASMTLDAAGFARRQWFIRLPKGAIADDLKEPSLFSAIQRSASALRRHDSLFLVEFDEAWAAEAVVASANSTGVTLAGMRILKYPDRTTALFSDENYKIEWAGNGYVVIRRRDSARVSQPVATEALAIRDLKNIYPQPVIKL